MELNLETQELLCTGPTAGRGILKVLPLGKSGRNKVVVTDDTGSITCFEVKKGQAEVLYKTPALPKPATRLALGGSASKREKVFVASGQQIRGYTKKGKEFLTFDTNLSETINCMASEETKIWTGGEYVYNTFDNGRDVNFFMAPDKINDLTVEHVTREAEYDGILACQDRFVRVIQGSTAALEAVLENPGTTLSRYQLEHAAPAPFGSSAFRQMVVGMHAGSITQLKMDSMSVRRGWTASRGSRKAPVTAMAIIDFTADDVPDILVGRDDGELTVFSFDKGSEPVDQFNTNIGESIRGIAAGRVSHNDYNEMIVVGFSGNVTSYTMEPLGAADTEDHTGRAKQTTQREGRIVKLRKELDQLKARVQKEKEKLSKVAEEFIPAEAQFKANVSFVLDADDAAYRLTVEIPMPIDVVALQSCIPVDLLDVDTNAAIVSRSPPDRANNNLVLATYRCQDSMNRLEMSVRTVEGQFGELQVITIAKMEPKTSQSVKVTIKPLSLHYRVHDSLDDRPVNVLTITGAFSMSQIHEWVVYCLPDVPGRVTEDEASFTFRNVFLGTMLNAAYKKGEAVFKSDSVSTIAILKEVITKNATSMKVRVATTFEIKDETIPHALRLIHPKLTYTLALARKVDLIEAIKEIKLQEEDTSFLAAEYNEVLENADKIRREFKNRPRRLEMLYGLVTDLYVDRQKFRGRNAQSKIGALLSLLERYDFDEVLRFFDEPV